LIHIEQIGLEYLTLFVRRAIDVQNYIYCRLFALVHICRPIANTMYFLYVMVLPEDR